MADAGLRQTRHEQRAREKELDDHSHKVRFNDKRSWHQQKDRVALRDRDLAEELKLANRRDLVDVLEMVLSADVTEAEPKVQIFFEKTRDTLSQITTEPIAKIIAVLELFMYTLRAFGRSALTTFIADTHQTGATLRDVLLQLFRLFDNRLIDFTDESSAKQIKLMDEMDEEHKAAIARMTDTQVLIAVFELGKINRVATAEEKDPNKTEEKKDPKKTEKKKNPKKTEKKKNPKKPKRE